MGGLIGIALTAFGQIQEGMAAKAQGESEAAIAEYNAQLSEQRAKEAEKAAAYEAAMHEKKGERLQARQVAGYAKAGVEFRGAPLAVLEETERELTMDKMMILREGTISAAQAKSQAQISRMRGEAAKKRGKYAYRGALLSAGGTMMTGLSEMGG